MKGPSSATRFLLFILLACLCAAPVSAQLNQFTGTNSSDYNDPGNWLLGTVPVGGETAVIGEGAMGAANPATASLTADAPSPLFEFKVGLGALGVGTMNHSAGRLVADNWSLVGDGGTGATPSNGTYNLSGTGYVEVGANGDGSLGVGAGGGIGEFNITSADAAVVSDGYSIGVGDDSVGVFNQSAGTVSANVWMNVGQEGAAMGTYNMSGGTLNTPELSIGENGPSNGTFNASGSSDLNLGSVRVGRFDGSTGSLSLDGSDVMFDAEQFSVASADGGATLDSTGTVSFNSDANGISTINVLGDVTLNDGLGAGSTANLMMNLTMGDPGGDLLLIDVGGSLTGQFTGLPEGSVVPGSNGRTITYDYQGMGNVALLVPEPSFAMLLLSSLLGLGLIRRR